MIAAGAVLSSGDVGRLSTQPSIAISVWHRAMKKVTAEAYSTAIRGEQAAGNGNGVPSHYDLTIRELDRSWEDSWTEYVARHPDASIYHGLQWRDAIHSVFRKQCVYLIATRSDDRVVGVLPLMRQKGWLTGDALVSLPYCNYGGPLADDARVADALIREAHAWARDNGSSRFEVRDVSQRSVDLDVRTDKVCMRLELPDSAEEWNRSLGTKRRNKIKRPQKAGVEVTVGGRELLNGFYSVFCANMRDLGTPVYPRSFFDSIWAGLGDRCSIVLANHEGEPVAGGFLIEHRGVMEIPWAGARAEYKRMRVNMFLYWRAIAHSIESGCRIFDFGRSTRDSGTYQFKREWGAQPRQLYWYVLPDAQGPGESASRASELWKKLPLPAANWLGPRITSNLPW